MAWAADEPYNELPPLPPTAEVETREVLKATIEARAALAALDQAARRIANPTVLINSIPLLEAQASSEIENIVTTTDELFRYAHDESAATNPATKETLNYRSALFAGVQLIQARPLSVTTAAEICTTVKGREMPIRRNPGTFIVNSVTHAAIYTPPVGEARIREKLGDWERFIHARKGIDPLVVMALAHYQFEAIHPFEDGNGRTGRILNVLMLMSAGLIEQPILYLSRYIIENKDEYYRLLLAVTRDGAWNEWILFIVEGIRQTATSTVIKIDQIQALQDRTLGRIREATGGANADLLAVLFEQPYCRIANVIDRCKVSRPTATNWLNALVEARALRDVRRGRERIFINTELLDVLVRADSVVGNDAEPALF
ncbi:MAG: Fic family protein [Pseudolysinimonas sp.]|uniref:Fic family protein n=1 Tax=Pseudolysinimonas sp. TaxID=2680009 RepID=UPI003C778EC6